MAKHLELADPHPLTANNCGDALACEAFKIARFGQCLIAELLAAILDDRLCQRMIAQAFGGGRNRKQLSFRYAGRCHNIGNPGLTFCKRTGLVESDGFERTEILERRAALYQNAAACCSGHSGQDRARGRDRQSAGAGSHKHRHRPVKTVAERLVDDNPGEKEQAGQSEHGGHKNSLKALRETLGRRLLSLGFAHHLDDLGEGRIARSPGHFHFERARSVDRPRKDAIVIRKIVRICARRSDIRNRALVDRHAFTGHRSLIDGTDAVQDETVSRKAFVRTHDYHVA